MATFSLFKDGRFCQSITGPEDVVIAPTLAAWEGDWAVGIFNDLWWLYGGQARKRRACPVVVDGLTLRGVRPGSVVGIEGKEYECPEGGDVELSFQYPGKYEITITRWPYLNGRYIVENPPSVE